MRSRIPICEKTLRSTFGTEVIVSAILNGGYPGTIAGTSLRFGGDTSPLGVDVWSFDPWTQTTSKIGLFGGPFAMTNGFQDISISGVSNAGHVYGVSSRFGPGDYYLGQSTWVYSPTSHATIQTGLQGSDYIFPADGFSYLGGEYFSFNHAWNSTGFVAGTTLVAPTPDSSGGRDAWIFNPNSGTTTRIGLTEYQYSVGYRGHFVTAMNSSGQVIGETTIVVNGK